MGLSLFLAAKTPFRKTNEYSVIYREKIRSSISVKAVFPLLSKAFTSRVRREKPNSEYR
jgi:hypothetical protein